MSDRAGESHRRMAREVSIQPKALGAALPLLLDAAAMLAVENTRPVWITGADARTAGLCVAGLFRDGGFDVRPTFAADILWHNAPRPGETLIALSHGGRTRRTIEALAVARTRRARTIALTTDAESPLARLAEQVLLLPLPARTDTHPAALGMMMTVLALAVLARTPQETCADAIDRLDQAYAPFAREAAPVAAGLKADGRCVFLATGPALGLADYGANLARRAGVDAMALEAESATHCAAHAFRAGDHAVLLGDGSAADARTAALGAGLRRLGLSVSRAGFSPANRLAALFEAALWCQLLSLTLATRRGTDLAGPHDGVAAEVQREWLAWEAP
ncbi:SIS domain-containing protein [Acuticoccus sp. M5D2P5]|uniref:SIS domain-containing protein n=1 Tax=Acuticoccus kalidii TaxID=2910977 RepID=UPI001F17CDCC|nr:SIS domain-containing protein [Acuticoccus kalidii]MCF3936196.1 SIS domain-containing protein [Acuticoccus kalidii]